MSGDPISAAIFATTSSGILSSRDAWEFNFSKDELKSNITRTIDFYNSERERWTRSRRPLEMLDTFLQTDSTKISWSAGLKASLARNDSVEFQNQNLRHTQYRPFTRQFLYFDRHLTERRLKFPHILPTLASENENKTICAPGLGNRRDFGSFVSCWIPTYDFAFEKTQCFPFYIYDEDGSNRRENITDWAIAEFRTHYNDATITKWDIFHYTYALLHSSEYRERYAANLKRELPRIPYAPDFRAYADAGKELTDLHINYEQQPEYPLEHIENPNAKLTFTVEKMRLGRDKSSLLYNDFLTLSGIPAETYTYRLGNRSALEWVIDQYQVYTDKRSGITNDPNREDDPEYILRLIGQVIHLSLETMKLVNALPTLALDTLAIDTLAIDNKSIAAKASPVVL
jgi:predicted helicase